MMKLVVGITNYSCSVSRISN